MDWMTLLGILLAGGGVGGIITAFSNSRRSNLDGCLELVKEQQSRIEILERDYGLLNGKLLDIISQRSTEERDNIRDVAKMSSELGHLKEKLAGYETKLLEQKTEYEGKFKEQSEVIGVLRSSLKAAEVQISDLKKKLSKYKGLVNEE